MVRVYLNSPRAMAWQNRLARMPHWAWIAFALGAIVPAVTLLAMLFFAAIVTGLMVMLAVLVVGAILNIAWRIFHRPDGRGNVQIVVRSARVIDP